MIRLTYLCDSPCVGRVGPAHAAMEPLRAPRTRPPCIQSGRRRERPGYRLDQQRRPGPVPVSCAPWFERLPAYRRIDGGTTGRAERAVDPTESLAATKQNGPRGAVSFDSMVAGARFGNYVPPYPGRVGARRVGARRLGSPKPVGARSRPTSPPPCTFAPAG